MQYGIIGTGAIGGYYGGKLAHAGKDVHFLLHRDYEFVKQNGFQVDSCDGSFHLDNPHVYQSVGDMPKCDVVLVGLKSVNNHLLPELLKPLLHDRSLVVLIQNGIGLEEDLQKQMPGVAIAAGLAFICSAKTQPGRVDHQCYGSINIGNYSCKDERLVQQVVDDFIEAGVETHLVEYEEARWKKAVWNMPFNGMTVALNTQTNLLLDFPETEQLIFEQMMEVIGAAQHLGVHNIDVEFAHKMIATTKVMTPYSPSMKLDYDFHRPMEIYYLYSRPIEVARKAGFHMPKLEMLEAQLKFLQVHSHK
ncbi:MAG: 2-dehydropantoate 2-reductase [Prevotella sp.]|nr:2-dehydropantoate 2-reductase [Prevotella sp.]